ncbi:hypothetical protein MCOR25_001822 [Pyricularia grisea]|uniref:Mid2 domain-containing protein n=1 Tax=Pyricularia grisea TaxID=148305 RepID=A0A6P8B4F1_PYRGI|nr:hypothetical protein PgNI_05285 [Pyricularia grisea]KAI6380171.1 hypothetical protein MCOR25_001822 [Pyricularia grisea]TLD10211.1 hypothetical protein PgNI_05285 [Pyricularia grisea]
MCPVFRTSHHTTALAFLIISLLCAPTLAAPVEVTTPAQLQLPSSTTASVTAKRNTISDGPIKQTDTIADNTHELQQHLLPRGNLQERVGITPESTGSIPTAILVVVGCVIGIGAASIAVFGFEWKRWGRGLTRKDHIDIVPRVEEKENIIPSTDKKGQAGEDKKNDMK